MKFSFVAVTDLSYYVLLLLLFSLSSLLLLVRVVEVMQLGRYVVLIVG